MHRFLALLSVIVLLSACAGKTADRKAIRGINFVSDPDHLYFKNVRARHYRAEEIPNRATIFRHDDLYASPARFRIALIDNWLEDRATLRYEVDTDHPAWTLQAATDAGWESLDLPSPPTAAALSALGQKLLSPRELRLVTPNDTLTAFPDGYGRAETRYVIADYLRLTDQE